MSKYKDKKNKIAIVGMSCRFPNADNYEQFWENMKNGISTFSKISGERWKLDSYLRDGGDDFGTENINWCAMVSDIDKFDYQFFGMSSKEANSLDPQQRILLEEAWKCIEDSAIAIKKLELNRTGVFVGVLDSEYTNVRMSTGNEYDRYEGLFRFENYLSHRISYHLNLTGPSETINTACTSGLSALFSAVRSIMCGECDYALAAATNLNLYFSKYVAVTRNRLISQNGKMETFGKDANGYVPADGMGVFLLQRLEDAVRDGNHIYGIIGGYGESHKGKHRNIIAPSVKGQIEAIKEAIKNASVPVEAINYMETHGAATLLGDPIEVEAINNVLQSMTDKKNFCSIGSVKPCVGYMEGASCVAGLIKVLLMLKYKKIPATKSMENLNPLIDFNLSTLKPTLQLEDWVKGVDNIPRCAGINAFSIGGNNAHVIIEEYEETDKNSSTQKQSISKYAFNLSAKSKESLCSIIEDWKKYIHKDAFLDTRLEDICLSQDIGRSSFSYRCGCEVRSKEDILKFLDSEIIIQKKKKGKWLLCIQKMKQFEGYGQIRTLMDCHPELKRELEYNGEMFDYEFTKGEWKEEDRNAYSLIVHSTILSWMKKCGIEFETVTGVNEGAILSLVMAGILELKDAIHMLSKKKSFDKQKIHRPEIPFYDIDGKQMIYPFVFSREYIQILRTVKLGHDYDVLREKAIDLLENQFTYKKCISEWDEIGQLIFHQDMESYIKGESKEEQDSKKKLLAAVIMGSSLRRICLKWDLHEQKLIEDDRYYEYLDLLSDGVLDRHLLLDVIFKEEDKTDYILEKLQGKREKLILGEDNYKYLRKQGTELIEMKPLQEWIQAVSEKQQDDFQLEDYSIISLEKEADSVAIYCEENGCIDVNYAQLWREGMDIQWDKVYKNVYYQKTVLPVYHFKQSQCQLDLRMEEQNIEKESPCKEQDVLGCEKVVHEKNMSGKVNVVNEMELDSTSRCDKKILHQYMSECLARILGVEQQDIDSDTEFQELGIDSVTLVEFSEAINTKFGTSINATLFFECQTIIEVTDYLCENYKISTEEKQPDEANCEEEKTVIKNEEASEDEIAIIGISGRFPDAENLDKFFQNLLNEKDSITEVPQDRWDWREYDEASGKEKNTSYSRWGGFLKDIDKFDAGFFKISPHEAARMDPQQRIILEETWNAMADAGYTPETLKGTDAGVYVGGCNFDYSQLMSQEDTVYDAYSSTGSYFSILPNRISHMLDLHGPSYAIDTACSSSLVAIHEAVKSIRNKECSMAFAAGVNIICDPRKYIEFSNAGMLAKDGRCKTFDDRADGYVRGEGVGVLLLKPLKDAVRAKDHIYGIVKGTAVNHCGRTNSLTAPSTNGQEQVIRKAYENAKVDMSTVSYIEAHGTGTSLGDPIEVNALKKAFHNQTGRSLHYCGIGTVKTNIGHLESAAGCAGVLKVLMMMKYGMIPKSLHNNKQNKYIDLEESPFYFVNKTKKWEHLMTESGEKIPYRAGISSFGFGGVNSHIVIEEYREPEKTEYAREEDVVIALSAPNMKMLTKYAQTLKKSLEKRDDNKCSIQDVSYTLLIGRIPMKSRLAFVASNKEQVLEKLELFCNKGQDAQGMYCNIVVKTGKKSQETNAQHKTLEELAKAWTQGELLSVEQLFHNKEVSRISLPAVPYQRQSYWIERKKIQEPKKMEDVPEYIEDNLDDKVETSYYKAEFIEDKEAVSSYLKGKNILVFSEDVSQWNEFLERCDIQNHIVVVQLGTQMEKVKEHIYSVNIEKENAFSTLADWLQEKGFIADDIVYCGNHDANILYRLLSLFNDLILKWKNKNITVTYHYLSANAKELPYDAAVAGFARSICQEQPKLNMRIVGYDNNSFSCERILSELSNSNDCEIQYKNQVRYRKVMTEQRIENLIEETDIYKENGVYLITGGLGGAGYEVAKHIANEKKVTLILVGRSDLDEKKRERCKALIDMGATVIYMQGDVTDRADVNCLVEDIMHEHGHLDGVIHCAGVVRDKYWLNKKPEDIHCVLQPKVNGTQYLAQALEEINLDFYVLFSSLVSETGNEGQCDYAYANAFMNHLADHINESNGYGRRWKHTIAIGWPFWQDGGMQLKKEELKILEERIGSKPLPTEQAMEVLDNLLCTQLTSCSVAYKNRNQNVAFTQNRETEEGSAIGNTSEQIQEEDFVQYVEEQVIGVFSKILEMDRQQIDLQANFHDYGVDSIMINHFNKEIEEKLGKLPKTLLYECSTIEEVIHYIVETGAGNKARVFAEKRIGKMKKINLSEPVKTSVKEEREDIAIIGVSGRYAMAENINKFWDNLKAGRDCISEIPSERWSIEEYYDENKEMAHQGKMYSKWGGFVKDIDKFDPLFFGISPKEAEGMDPQERLMLEEAWLALEDAGYNKVKRNSLKKDSEIPDVGVFVGATTNTYSLWAPYSLEANTNIIPNTFFWSIANRISYLFNFSGPSMATDTACSSSLTAVHLACQSLKNKECNMAVAGGVNLYTHPIKYIQLCQLNMLSPTGRCHSYGEEADGFVPGEGAGALILKRLSDAKKDNDRIYAVIKGSAVNHDGYTSGYTVPNPNAQAELIKTALKKADVKPETITYVEGHGTGTKLGDPIEVAGLTKSVGNRKSNASKCVLGSVKANIGHLEAAAGVAGITKLLLMMKYKKIVPSIHCEVLNSNITFEDTPFYIQRELVDWDQSVVIEDGKETRVPRRACISGFGAGGTNVSIVMEEYEEKKEEKTVSDQSELIVLSAKSEKALRSYAKQMAEQFQTRQDVTLRELAYTLQMCRDHMEDKLAFVVSSKQKAVDILRAYGNGLDEIEGLYLSKTFAEVNVDSVDKNIVSYMEDKKGNWGGTFLQDSCKVVSLPGYPFEKRGYWFNSFKQKKRTEPIVPVKKESIVKPEETVITVKQETTLQWEENEDEKGVYNGSEVTMEIIDGNIALIHMEDRERKNLFSKDMHRGLWNKINEINSRTDIKTVILTGYDNLFCMGGTDEQLTSIAANNSKCSEMSFVFKGMLQCKVPVITAMQGHAMGGGFVLGMFGDITVMSRESIYSVNFTRYGFTPGVGATYILKERLGSSLANEMMFTAKSYTGEELEKRGAGFIFATQESVLEEAVSIARTLTIKPMETLVTLKQELAGRMLQVIPGIIKSEIAMHRKVFSQVDVSSRIKHYFALEEEPKTEKAKKLNLKNKNVEQPLLATKAPDKKLKLRNVSECGLATECKPAREKVKLSVKSTDLQKDIAERTIVNSLKLEQVEAAIKSILSEKLHIPEEDVKKDRIFQELGVDSISAVEIIRELNKQYKLNMDAVCIFDYPSCKTLAEYIMEETKKAALPKKDTYDQGDQRRFFSSEKQETRKSQKRQVVEEKPAKVPVMEKDDTVLEKLMEIVEEILHVNKESIDCNKELKLYGMDSINVIEIMNQVNKEFLLQEDTTIIYDYPSIKQLANYISKLSSGQKESSKTNERFERKNFGATAESQSRWFQSVNEEKQEKDEKDEEKELGDILTKFKNGQLDTSEVEQYLGDLL